jgi:hypothetical protein
MLGKKDALDRRVASVFVLPICQNFKETCWSFLQGRKRKCLFNIDGDSVAASMYSNWLAQRYILADNTVHVYIQH